MGAGRLFDELTGVLLGWDRSIRLSKGLENESFDLYPSSRMITTW
jgi:hypothetical protein